MRRRILILLPTMVALLAASPAAPAATTTVRYGPYTIPAGTMADPGMIHTDSSSR